MTTPEARELLAAAGGYTLEPGPLVSERSALDAISAALSRSQPVEAVGLVEALEAIQSEAERTNGSWVHLKRVIGVKARSALATFRSAQGEGNDG